MAHLSLTLLQVLGASSSGLAIGYFFGVLHEIATKHNARLQQEGRLKSAWSVMPGSAGRVALLLIVLAMVQFTCPMFFQGGVEWCVSGGVAVGYGIHQFMRLKQRLKQACA